MRLVCWILGHAVTGQSVPKSFRTVAGELISGWQYYCRRCQTPEDFPVHQLEEAAARALEHACWRLRDLKALVATGNNVVQLGFLQAHPLIRELSAYRVAFPS